jgi:transcriptional regulator with XRE-family HTH domain
MKLMTIGERIKKLREEKNISVDKLAELIGKNRATIYRYESNEIEKLPTSVLEPLCKALDTTPAYIMGWTDSELSSTLPTQSENDNNNDIFSNHEKKVINAYRNKPEMQPAVDKLLGVEDDSNEEYVTVLTASRSSDNRPIEFQKISKEKLELLKNAKSVEDESDL